MSTHIKTIACVLIIIAVFCVGCEPEPAVRTQPEISEPLVSDQPAEAAEPKPPAVQPQEPEKPAEPKVIEAEPVKPVVEETKPVEQTPEEPDPNAVAVTVNGFEITEAQIEQTIKPQLDRMMTRGKNRKRPQNYIENTRKRLRQQALEGMIIEQLIDKEIAKENIVVTEEDVNEQIQQIASGQSLSVDDLKALIEAHGSSFEQWKEKMQFPKRLGLVQLMEAQSAGDVNVADEEAMEYYNKNKSRFEKPEMVRASHILIKPDTSDPNKDPNQADAEALAKAEQLLKEIKDGADFAELAGANSGCPSASKGGDLNFFRRGQMVPPFDNVAFELEIGQISDVVKTRFGYHIIKVTDHKDASVTSFEQAKEGIVAQLQQEKTRKLIGEYIESLKEKAVIVYPQGKEPEKPGALTGRPPIRPRPAVKPENKTAVE